MENISIPTPTRLLDNEAIELEFISVLIYYYTYMRKLEKEESMMCRNDKSGVGPRQKHNNWFGNKTLVHADQLEWDLFSMFSDNPSPGNIKINVDSVTGKTYLSSNIIIDQG